MAKTVTTIPATLTRFTATPINQVTKRRTAGYARVSTESEEQQTSYEAQVDYYTNYIKGRSDWEFVEVYTDDGISATNTKRREGFKRMIADALAGKIDLIVTKSVSRFARNTVDSLTTVRKLKEKGIEVYFEKENIWTLDSKGELLITIMSSLAQEESRSISENCTWGQRKRFADGKVSVPFGHFLGYDRGKDGNLVINPEQAITVRNIYSMFMQGMTPYTIASKLTAEGILSPGGKLKWDTGTVKRILTNEKYKGDALLQKSYTVDFLTKKKKINKGEIPQYYVENNHQAIIQPEQFEIVQREIERRNKSKERYSGINIFSGRIRCGQCGSWYGSKIWHSTDKYHRVIWRCNHKYNGEKKCTTPHLTEAEIQQSYISAVNKLLANKNNIISGFAAIKDTVFNLDSLTVEQNELRNELEVVSELMQQCINENAHVAIDQTEYQKRYDDLSSRFEKTKSRLEMVTDEINDKRARQASIEKFLNELRRQKNLIADFTPELWYSLIDFMTVYGKGDVRVTFKDGTEVQA